MRRRLHHARLPPPRGAVSPVVRCVAALVVVALLTLGVAWGTWQAVVDTRVRLGEAAADGRDVARALPEDDLEQDLEQTLGRTIRAGSPEAPAAAPDSGGGVSVLGGPAFAAGGVGVVVVGGVVAGRLVLRRYRSRRYDPNAEISDAEVSDDGAGDEGSPVSDGPEASDEADNDATADVDEPGKGSANDGGDGLDADYRRPAGHSSAGAGDQAPDAAHGGLAAAVTWTQGTPGVPRTPALDRTPPTEARGVEPIEETRPVPSYAAGERLFERRKAERVAVSVPGSLTWRDYERTVTVADLSETGLRCVVHDHAGTAGASRLPGTRDHVRVSCSLGGRAVTLAGQVAWRRSGDGGYELGLNFVALPQDALELVREAVSAVPVA